MKAVRVRLVVAGVLMAGWIGYLGFLALGHSKPIVVSRSQLLHASHYVKADVIVDADNKPVATVAVQDSFGASRVVEKSIEIVNLVEVRLPNGKPLAGGSYFLPLNVLGPGQYRVASAVGIDAHSKCTAYPWTNEVERQVREFVPAR